MKQSTLARLDTQDLHVAIIMDGNGRWAARRGLPRSAGHRAGARVVEAITEAAPKLGIRTLTLYAFSADNWRRPDAEVAELLTLLREHLRQEAIRCARNGVRVNVIGRRDRLPWDLQQLIEWTELFTAAGERLHLRLAVDYSAREAIVLAATALATCPPSRQAFGRALNRAIHSEPAAPDVDLLIRTSGEQRLSDYLLWECAYAELYFCPTLWPDFGAAALAAAVADFQGRERRFGAIADEAAGGAP